MTNREKQQLLLSLWPWILSLGFAFWLSSPIWRFPEFLFMGKPSSDNMMTPWFFDFFARSFWAGDDYSVLGTFDYPNPMPRVVEFPSVMDAYLFSPITLFFPWPAQWAWSLTAVLVFQAFSMSMLTWAMGLSRWSIAFAGMSAILSRPMWAELVKGRMNVLLPGLVLLAITGLILSFAKIDRGESRSMFIRIVGVILAFVMGATAALVYPPFLLLLVPLGLVAVWNSWKYSGLVAVWLPLAIMVAVYGYVYDDLWQIYALSVKERVGFECPDIYNRLDIAYLMLWDPIPLQGLSFSGLQGAPWLLAGFALLHSKYRYPSMLLLMMTLLFTFLSLGPCVFEDLYPNQATEQFQAWKIFLQPLWQFSVEIHNFGRFGFAVSLFLSLLGAIALDWLWKTKRRSFQIFSIVCGSLILYLSYKPMIQEITHPSKWHAYSTLKTNNFLADQEGKNIAELPFDRSVQFVSALQYPNIKRANSARPYTPPRTETRFYRWLFAVGRSEEVSERPTTSEIQNSGLDLILFDPFRCQMRGLNKKCASWLKQELVDVLGEPQKTKGLWVWYVED